MLGVDISYRAIEFCQRYYHRPGLCFLQGDAESLPLDSMTFDAIINIESSYGYGHVERFLQEAYRILRPHGHFLFADYRNREDMELLRQHFIVAGFKIHKEEQINLQVLHALDLDEGQKQQAIQRYVPWGLSKVFHYFAAMKGSKMYHALQSGETDYRCFVLQKEERRR